MTARLHSLAKSSEQFPLSLVLLEEGEKSEIVGHSRVCKVIGQPTACLLESVVIRRNKRGLGLGRILMRETELQSVRRGFTEAYLTTHDKQNFYAHLGYEYCSPVVTLGSASNLLSEHMCEKLFSKKETLLKDTGTKSPSSQLPPGAAPPPPGVPPPPPPPQVKPKNTPSSLKISWMKKKLT
ncbi:hypothetical protein CAPTEDRAFT_169672 [Capitella teleta]|uniref:N-acetyltransferase domain-containing protein n=1 Tax=Capitella teleta TaxID=283909 RepID=R7U9U0_CAPTE|nr:hypothetical protein CAPTEDRAFT_169672 [Capitella teleta]|eukprot:ELU02891.1 hypothetical protein CAPTEDRAFT_169672 [Capitella teleta]